MNEILFIDNSSQLRLKTKGWKIYNRQITINKYGNITTSGDRIDDVVVQLSSHVQLSNTMDHSMPDLPVPYHLPEFPKFMSIALVMPCSHLIL